MRAGYAVREDDPDVHDGAPGHGGDMAKRNTKNAHLVEPTWGVSEDGGPPLTELTSEAAGAFVAVSLAVTAVSDGDDASNWYEPDVGPSMRPVLARPLASVTAVAVATLAPPVTARNATGTPETGRLSDACASTTSGCGIRRISSMTASGSWWRPTPLAWALTRQMCAS